MTYTNLRDLVISEASKLLGLLTLSHWLNNSFIAFKNEYNFLLHLLVVFLQVLNVPWS